MEENETMERGTRIRNWIIGFLLGLMVGIGGTTVAWNGKCSSIDKASRGPVYEIPLGANASQFATAYNNRVYMMLEAPTRPDRASDPAVRK